MAFSFEAVTAKVGAATQATETELADHVDVMDPNSSQDLMKTQFLTQKWSVSTSVESALYKTLGDGLKGISNKI